MYDIGIIGGGTAGLTAAIYGQRAGKRTLVIEGLNFGGQIVNSPKVENYPGLESISGSQYSMNLLNQAMKLGAETASERVKEVREEDGIKIIVTDQKEYPCKAVILATGVAHRHLGIPQEEALAGSGVSYCATCDGAFYKKKVTAVIGGGDVAVEDAIFLAGLCEKVYLIHRRDSLRAAKSLQEKLFTLPNVELVWNAAVEEITGEAFVTGVQLLDTQTKEERFVAADGIFIAVGIQPVSESFKSLVKTDEAGYICAGEDCCTSVPGIFAVGDVRTKKLRQIVTAVADGANAVNSVQEYFQTR